MSEGLRYLLICLFVLTGLLPIAFCGLYLSARRHDFLERVTPWLSWCFVLPFPSVLLGPATGILLFSRSPDATAFALTLAACALAWSLIEVALEFRRRRKSPRHGGRLVLFAHGAAAGMRRILRYTITWTGRFLLLGLPVAILAVLTRLREDKPEWEIACFVAIWMTTLAFCGQAWGTFIAYRLAQEFHSAHLARALVIGRPSVGSESLLKGEPVNHYRSPGHAGWLHFLRQLALGALVGFFVGLYWGFVSRGILGIFHQPEATLESAMSYTILIFTVAGACLDGGTVGRLRSASHGWLYLTNKRLVFEPIEPDSQNAEWSVPLQEIQAAKSFITGSLVFTLVFLVFRHGLQVVTGQGTERFWVEEPGSWTRAIAHASLTIGIDPNL